MVLAGFVNGCRWFWVVLLVPCFSNYAHMYWTSSLFSFRSAFSKHTLLVMSYSNNRLNQ